MSRFNLKSLFLGIGIGIIITAVAGLIYAAGRDPMEGLSKEQIMGQAEKYGMIRPSILQGTASESQTGLVEESTSKQ
ncbi:MAG TPA: hypothetical protein VHT96_01865 [Clostridia bacterium]|nr:hypothetical protein [Clostridia bacterium]